MTENRMLSGGFKLGTFSTNCSSGMTPTQAKERWVNSWDNNLALAKLLDAAGIDFMLPIARWIGHGRAGLNIVAGWNKPEHDARGLILLDHHETRYGYAQDWYDLIGMIC